MAVATASPVAANLEVICERIDALSGEWLIAAIILNLVEYERLGWDVLKGIEVKIDNDVEEGHFRLHCRRGGKGRVERGKLAA
jgi:hypothetical protein